jgi:hypothetical protein
MKHYTRHPISAAFGDLSETEFIELQDCIRGVGMIEPIMIYEGQILDGWQRSRAALALGIDCPEAPFTGSLRAAADWVIAKHTRRSMSPSARTLAIVKLAEHCSARAGRPGNSVTVTEFLTVGDISKQADVSHSSVHRARIVARDAIPEVGAAVEQGKLPIGPAARIAKLPRDEQATALVEEQARKRKHRKTCDNELKIPFNELQVADLQKQVEVANAEITELKERNAILVEEYDAMQARLAIHFMQGTDEERLAASALIADLQSQVKVLTAELNAVKATRNHLQDERNELIDQCRINERRLKRAAKQAQAGTPAAQVPAFRTTRGSHT